MRTHFVDTHLYAIVNNYTVHIMNYKHCMHAFQNHIAIINQCEQQHECGKDSLSVFAKTLSFPGKRNVKDVPVRPEGNERGGVRSALIHNSTINI